MTEPSFKLSSRGHISALGFRTYALFNEPGKTYKSVRTALKAGYQHLDCAEYYLNEVEIGNAIYDFLQANPSLSYNDLFIITKVWNHLYKLKSIK
jgi:diketogulonate reductase-like aldo/keto reductase